VTGLLAAQNIVHVENIVTVLVIVAIILGTLARLCQNSARVSGRLVVEVRVANTIGRGEVTSQGMKWL
jgi:hypothetical protein